MLNIIFKFLEWCLELISKVIIKLYYKFAYKYDTRLHTGGILEKDRVTLNKTLYTKIPRDKIPVFDNTQIGSSWVNGDSGLNKMAQQSVNVKVDKANIGGSIHHLNIGDITIEEQRNIMLERINNHLMKDLMGNIGKRKYNVWGTDRGLDNEKKEKYISEDIPY